ncbi:uncharacterized protein ASPGLDRAFT_77824 [Aspergillus glaucus CBS 516.65]|uniref:Major facilitator superfamily (MFS) profile domain-containing protein n=1 Tax=Aspergillus glaucus CBS 516.65 TaxID=1160497 RepID=A0A1L9V5J7_ASPGL|nr:hypothetical protein ASPGLDRAFT_77824 [Aspergillus glaucus CBS 516.65]OJJ79112.1 hypothetical protein ASPGLDRAFT_77824 [Aspergillus glaucus CBS 516.65]
MKNLKEKALYRVMRLCCCLVYDAGVLGGVQETRPFHEALGNSTGSYIIPMVASSYTLAATVCALAVSWLGMPLGRRGCIAEMSLTEKERGPEVAFQCIFLVSGCAFAYWVDFGFTRLNNQISWRFPMAFQAGLAVVSGVGMFLLPGTPRWYYIRGRFQEGDEILSRLHDRAVSDPAVQEMRQSVLSSLEHEAEQTKRLNVLDLLWDRTDLRVGRRIRVAFLTLSVQQMMGKQISFLQTLSPRLKHSSQESTSLFTSVTIFSQIGLSFTMCQLLAAVMNTTFAMGSFLLPFTIERFGRRRIMMYLAAALTICLTVLVTMIGSPEPTLAKQWVAVAVIVIYNLIFGYGWIGVCWLYGPEIAPLQFRHVGGTAAAFGEWLFCFFTVFAGGIGLEKGGRGDINRGGSIPFVYFFMPETILEEIDYIFVKQKSCQ